MRFAKICLKCFLLLALAALASFDSRGAEWKADPERGRYTASAEAEDYASGVALTGKLTLADESPVPDVLITLKSGSALRQTGTDEYGTFLIPELAPGDYLFRCSLPGFATRYRLLRLQAGQIRRLDLQLDAIPTESAVFTGGIIEGNVYINDKIPFSGVKVTATAKGYSQTVISMNNGEFRFFGLQKDRTYTLRFSHEGFQDITATCAVVPEMQPKTEIHFMIPWLRELPEPPASRPEAKKTKTFSFDWQAWEKAIGAVFIEKYGKEIIDFERGEIAALLPADKIDLYMEHFEKGLMTDTGMTIIEGGENRWLESAECSGSQYRQVFIMGYNQGSLNATLEKKADWKVEWQAFIKEWSKFIIDMERRKAEALMDKEKVNAYMKSFGLGLNSNTGMNKKKLAPLESASRFGFHYQSLFEKGYRDGAALSAGDSLNYTKKIE